MVLALVGVVAAVAVTAGQTRQDDAQRRRDQIQMMEGVLTRAVRLGADQLGRRLQSTNPNLVLFTGDARARGFVLEGYGVFFDVEIPALRKSVMWTMRTLERDVALNGALDALRRIVESIPQGPSRLQAEQALKRIQLQVGPMPQLPPGGAAPQREVAAATAEMPQPLQTDDDPDAAYTESVKRALVDAMLDYSLPMDLHADEWLTVAARDSEGPMVPGQVDDAMTILLRIKGSDLAAYAADRTKREEFRKRVEVHVF
jgi:hypothetical protein